MTTTESKAESRSDTREAELMRRVYRAHKKGDTTHLRRWRPGVVDVNVIALTQDASPREYPVWALTAKLFVLVGRGLEETWVNRKGRGTGIGRWAYFAKPRNNGKADPQCERLLVSLTRAETLDEVHDALVALASVSTQAPDWFQVLNELTEWTYPHRREQVRYRWAQQFHTPPKKPTVSAETAEPTES